MTKTDDPIIWRPDLAKQCDRTSETIRRWIKANKLPKPDVWMSQKTMGWKASTLRAAGIMLA